MTMDIEREVTAIEVKEACLAAGITRIEHHKCSFAYLVGEGGELFFDSGCFCVRSLSNIEQREWESAARWINMQSEPANKAYIAKKFGLKL